MKTEARSLPLIFIGYRHRLFLDNSSTLTSFISIVPKQKLLIAFGLLAQSLVMGCAQSPNNSSPQIARDYLSTLKVSTEDFSKPYSRELFGDEYRSDKDDCRDTRQELLLRDSKLETTGLCKILTGLWQSPFESFSTTLSSEITVDHLVALKEAWVSGASSWTPERRDHFFNDLDFEYSLSLMSKSLNSEKSWFDPASWLPEQSVCDYVVRWVAVKYRWGLSVDQEEKEVLTRTLSGACGDTEMSVATAD